MSQRILLEEYVEAEGRVTSGAVCCMTAALFAAFAAGAAMVDMLEATATSLVVSVCMLSSGVGLYVTGRRTIRAWRDQERAGRS